ncbi:mucin-6-like [Centruroides sculpturatus]|uniref:mucin-6-like n=1 Tax=Centruroides sculpturatus TaxID=218467 RepID=UPI000C6D89C2|nr:mucin-6-like [Centruroides sculpturatus]
MIIALSFCILFPLQSLCETYRREVCGLNEEYSTCKEVCPDTCENYGTKRICDWWQCESGCQCKKGFVRDSNGDCIKPTQCTNPTVCNRQGEEYSECGKADYCQLTCENINDPSMYWCRRKYCQQGCFCKKGFVRDFNWNCIPKEECPKKTGPGFNCSKPNEYYQLCGSACPPTCQNYGKTMKCPLNCVEGCFCREDLVRDSNSENQSCIYPAECTNPPVCIGPGEEYQFCGTDCPLTCENYKSPPTCTAVCKSGCFCKKGLVRDMDGDCVLPKHCSKICKEREVLHNCGCENKCTGFLEDYTLHCPNNCTKACSCEENMARHPVNGLCIPKEECPEIHPYFLKLF